MAGMSETTRPAEQTSTAATIEGALRDYTVGGRGRKRIRKGDIAVIDSADLSSREAQTLIDAEPAAVVNMSRFTTGTVPNYGPLMLLREGIPLFENAGSGVADGFRDGAKKGSVVVDGTLHNGAKVIGKAEPFSQEAAETGFTEAQRSFLGRMESNLSAAVEFVHSESPLLVDGLGIPDVEDEIRGRKVLVVSPGPDHRRQVEDLRNFIREYDPVLIGVESSADTLLDLGYRPDFVIGNPVNIAAETLRSGARVILPADPEGHATGLERIQELGVGAMTFPAATESPTDLALLMANYHDAEIIVAAGAQVDLDGMFHDQKNATPAALLTRAKVGPKLVDADVIVTLYTVSSGRGTAWLWALLGILVALAAIILVVGLGGDESFTDNLIDTWNGLALTVQGWFN